MPRVIRTVQSAAPVWCLALGAAATIVVSLAEQAQVNCAGLIDSKCLVLRKLFGGVRAAQ